MKVEFFIPQPFSTHVGPVMHALIQEALTHDQVTVTNQYRGADQLLVIYGVGAADRAGIRDKHVASGRPVMIWDLGYFGHNGNRNGWLRSSIDHEHPQAYLDRTPLNPVRWEALGIPLREEHDPKGHILLIGLGRKSRSYLKEYDWETTAYERIVAKYPGQKIIYRPKPGHPAPPINIETNTTQPINVLLKGAALVVCRHSNVAVDAVIAGVPFEAEDGAAVWLLNKPYTRENRLEFLHRLAYWNWSAREARMAWPFMKGQVLENIQRRERSGVQA